jgi:hypothetical protein
VGTAFARIAPERPPITPREVYLYHVVDNAGSMAEYGSQAVVWQTAVNLLTGYGSPWACDERSPAAG